MRREASQFLSAPRCARQMGRHLRASTLARSSGRQQGRTGKCRPHVRESFSVSGSREAVAYWARYSALRRRNSWAKSGKSCCTYSAARSRRRTMGTSFHDREVTLMALPDHSQLKGRALPGSGMAGDNAEDGSVLGAGAGWVLSCLYLRCLFFRAQWLGTASKWRRPRGVFPPSIMHASPHIRSGGCSTPCHRRD